jgi:uncharacterized heparinase superfamily protein
MSYRVRRAMANAFFAPRAEQLRARMASAVPADARRYLRERSAPRFHFGDVPPSRIGSSLSPRFAADTLNAADSICGGRFCFRGVGVEAGCPPDWGRGPGPAWIWDLNRHFYFSRLGFAYWYSNDAKYLRSYCSLSSSWARSQSGRLGRLTWDHPFEVAARLNGWIWGLFLFLPSEEWDPLDVRECLVTIGLLAAFLHVSLETHNPGNHILLEAKALVVAGMLFPELPGAQRWRERGWRLLSREVQRQIGSDGVHLERSTMYHRIVAGELAELALLCRRNGLGAKARELGVLVASMADFQAATTFDDGSFALFGDAYLEDTYYRFDAPTVARALGHDVPRSPVAPASEELTLWALHAESAPPARVPARRSRGFPDGGYFVSEWESDAGHSSLIWDCGPVGYADNLNHAHLDALSLVWTHAGAPLLIDPGTSERSRELRRELRTTGSHNTLLIDDEPQSEFGPRESVLRCARATVLLFEVGSDCDLMMGCHDGYRRLAEPAEHLRCVVVMKQRYCLVLDRVEGRGLHRVSQRFHAAPGLSLELDDRVADVSIRGQRVHASVMLFRLGPDPLPPKVALINATAELRFGHPENHVVICHEGEGLPPLVLGALLVGDPKGEAWGVTESSADGTSRAATFRVEGPAVLDDIAVHWGCGAKGPAEGAEAAKPSISIRHLYSPPVAGRPR